MSIHAVPVDALPAITKIVEYAETEIQSVTGLNIRVKLVLEKQDVTITAIQQLVCEQYNVSWKQISSLMRNANFVIARYTFMYLCWHYFPDIDDTEIAGMVNRERTSVGHARKNIRNLLQTNDTVKTAIENIQFKLSV